MEHPRRRPAVTREADYEQGIEGQRLVGATGFAGMGVPYRNLTSGDLASSRMRRLPLL